MKRVGLVGARGHTGAELVRLIEAHPGLELAFAGSRAWAGKPLADVMADATSDLTFEAITPGDVTRRVSDTQADAVVLALPNGYAAPYASALPATTVVVDLSADHRFDDAWTYGLVERNRAALQGATRIANPGCYATGAQLAIAPLVDELAAPPRVFGVSGYSGAGTTPPPKNDPERLRDNLMPYAPVGHTHEREIGRHLHPVHFMPHVAPHFRGISLTIDLVCRHELTELEDRYRAHYDGEPLVVVQAEPPEVRDVQNRHGVHIGGFATDGARVVVMATIDNLLKGAATQAVQNLNLGLALSDPWQGIPVDSA